MEPLSAHGGPTVSVIRMVLCYGAAPTTISTCRVPHGPTLLPPMPKVLCWAIGTMPTSTSTFLSRSARPHKVHAHSSVMRKQIPDVGPDPHLQSFYPRAVIPTSVMPAQVSRMPAQRMAEI